MTLLKIYIVKRIIEIILYQCLRNIYRSIIQIESFMKIIMYV